MPGGVGVSPPRDLTPPARPNPTLCKGTAMKRTRLSASVQLLEHVTDGDLADLDTKHRATYLEDASNAGVRVSNDDCLAWWPRANG